MCYIYVYVCRCVFRRTYVRLLTIYIVEYPHAESNSRCVWVESGLMSD